MGSETTGYATEIAAIIHESSIVGMLRRTGSDEQSITLIVEVVLTVRPELYANLRARIVQMPIITLIRSFAHQKNP